MIKLWNTLARRKEIFVPLKKGSVGLYTCGPTVYNYAHIGNLRTYIFEDILRRAFEYVGFKVKHVMNITDVGHLAGDADAGEEKMEAAARRERKTAWEIAKFYEKAFEEDLKKLNVEEPTLIVNATDHIAEQIALIKILEEKGFTYATSDGVYFNTSKFARYGRLSRQKLSEKAVGTREIVKTEKKHPADFALWKFSPTDRKRDMEWKSPWGVGFPGWHIECSAMSRKYLGQPFDIHTGGIDHVSVHHENEIAQSEAAYGAPLARYWLHGEFLTIDGGRMGKSEGNFITLADVLKRGFDPLAYRYFTLGAHYRSKLTFSWDALAGVASGLKKIRDELRGWPRPAKKGIATILKRFRAAVEDDLNMPAALAVFHDLLGKTPTPAGARTALDMDKVFGLNLARTLAEPLEVPRAVRTLVAEREAARKRGDWPLADARRREIERAGFVVEDTPTGPRVREA